MQSLDVETGDIILRAEVLGPSSAPVIVLLAGNGCSAAWWPDDFCAHLVDGGFRVVRFDYRDTGYSTRGTTYDLDDLATDVLAIMDRIDVAQVHLVGLSMGGFVAQRLALTRPDRILSVASMLSTSDYATMLHAFCGGEEPTSGLPPPSAAWLAALGRLPPGLAPAELVLESWRLACGTQLPFDRAYWLQVLASAAKRGDDTAAGEIHRAASLRTRQLNLLPELASLRLPTVFIGGSEDPIFPPGHASASALATPNGRVVMIDGLGHALVPTRFASITAAIIENTRRGLEPDRG